MRAPVPASLGAAPAAASRGGEPDAVDLSCLFVNYNSWRLLAGALESLRQHAPAGLRLEIVVVDNASPARDDEARAAVQHAIERTGGKLVMHGANGGYGAGMNLAFAHSRGRVVLAANPDVLFAPGAIATLVAHLDAHADAGVVAPNVYGDEALTVAMPAHVLPTIGDLVRSALASVSAKCNRRHQVRRTRDALPVWRADAAIDEAMFGGCCFVMLRAVVERIGFFDERYPLYFEDTDLAMRVRRAGLRIVRVPAARVVHLYDGSAATDRDEAMRRYACSRRRFFARWHGLAGRLALAATTRFLASRWATRRTRAIAARAQPVTWVDGRPLLVLPRRCERFLIEIAFEPLLLLAAGTFGSGDRWTPGDALRRRLTRDAWLRAVDLDGDEPAELGFWHCPAAPPA